MDIFDVLNLIGGLCLFLFGMNLMGQALERRAGNKLRSLLGRMTTNRIAGLLTGLGVTAVIQSSSATTVMVVGFVNSGLMTLRQAINVIMGANVGTTVTAWILSLAGIDSSNVFIRLLKPSSFVPVLALIGIILYMFSKQQKRKDTGTIFLGFATLMFGMEAMSAAVTGLRDVPEFTQILVMFRNPFFGVLAGALLTAVIQSSSASVGILQALAVTGQVSFGVAIPIIMGQNIGTCITAMLSSVGANKNAKRAALVHLSFNVIGTVVCLSVFCAVDAIFAPAILTESANAMGIAVVHSLFNLLCTALMLPMAGWLEKLVCHLVRDSKQEETTEELDRRLLTTPPIALARCSEVVQEMAQCAVDALQKGMDLLRNYEEGKAEEVQGLETRTDRYEDKVGAYLVELSTLPISAEDSAEAARLLKNIGDLERIADHAVNLSQSARELADKKLSFSPAAQKELNTLCAAVSEALRLSLEALCRNDRQAAFRMEPLEEVIDDLKETLRSHHIRRLQKEHCSMEAGFVWSDILTDLERVSDHCSNIAGSVLNTDVGGMMLHEALHAVKNNREDYRQQYREYCQQYAVDAAQ